MEICSDAHTEIVYDSNERCPLCEANKEIFSLEDEIEELKRQLADKE